MELTVQARTAFGRATAALRKQGLIPAELYGGGVANLHLAVGERDFKKVFEVAGETTVLTLAGVEGSHRVLIHDVQYDYLTGNVSHVDFYAVRADKKIKAKVPIELTGEAPAVKQGGIVNRVMAEIEVEALPDHLPHTLKLDLSSLTEFGKSLHVKDITIPENVTFHVAPETVVVSISEPRKEEEVAVPVEPVDVTTVKVEGDEKKAERAAKKAEEEKKA